MRSTIILVACCTFMASPLCAQTDAESSVLSSKVPTKPAAIRNLTAPVILAQQGVPDMTNPPIKALQAIPVQDTLETTPAPIAEVPKANGSCDGCNGCNSCNRFQLGGWISAGYVWNTDSPTSKFNGPYNSVDRSNEPMLNQFYLYGEKNLPACGMGFGGRIDMLYGLDFNVAESDGFERRQDGSSHWNPQYYGLAFPQAYFSFGNEQLSLQFGHFYTVVGYESVMAPENFFYSKSYSYQFSQPFTHWGLLANFKPNECWTVQMGLANGSDALDRVSDDIGFLGSARYEAGNGRWTSLQLYTGKDFNNSAGLLPAGDFTNRTRLGWLFGTPIGCCWEYIFNGFYGTQQDGAVNGGDATWYGTDHYLYRKINRCWKAGGRFEWFRDTDGTRVGLNRPSNPNTPPFVGNFFSLAMGMNWSPSQNLVFRPELRYDWYDGTSVPVPYDDGNSDSQFLLGFDAIFSF